MLRTRATAALAFAGLGASMLAMGSFAIGGVALAAAVLSMRPSIVSQGIARSAVWATLLPNLYVTLLLAPMGHAPPLRAVAEMGLAIAALVVARPLLSTERARAEFAPLALRPWFLASAVGAMASGVTLAMLAQSFAHFPALAREAIGLAALAIPLFVAGVGVLRMRAWGVVLGVLAALASIPVALWMRDPFLTIPVLLASAPAALMGALVAIARLRPVVRHRVEPNLRVAAEDVATVAEWTPSDYEECSPPPSFAPRLRESSAMRLRSSSTPPK
ncbi:MAG TPA: hypothetical protein VH054_07015 [Polyangiaceae bacterium]|nr:hypothetical protein [Polyangiaceae bacterium]